MTRIHRLVWRIFTGIARITAISTDMSGKLPIGYRGRSSVPDLMKREVSPSENDMAGNQSHRGVCNPALFARHGLYQVI
jgi:hypothetical protein